MNRCCVAASCIMTMLLMTGPASAHSGGPLTPSDLWHHWNLPLLFPLMIVAYIYFRGVGEIQKRRRAAQSISFGRTSAFTAGIMALFVALVSPLDALSESLFSAHMAQHLILWIVAPPLLVFSKPLVPLLWGIPLHIRYGFSHMHRWFRHLWRLMQPAIIWSLHTATLWLWHIPSLYEAALFSTFIHSLEHISFLGISLLYWWSLFYPKRDLGYAISVLSLFATAVQGSLLGAVLTFSQVPWYSAYAATVPAWGFTLLEDQQLAGVIMWLPSGLTYLVAALCLLAHWLGSMERQRTNRFIPTIGGPP